MAEKRKKISLIGSRVTSVLSVTLVLIVVGLCITLGIAIDKATRSLGNETTILVTMQPDADKMAATNLKQYFKKQTWSQRFEYTDAATILSREISAMSDQEKESLELLSENPYSDEFVVYVAPGWRSTDSLKSIARQVEALPGVEMVGDDATAIGNVNDGVGRLIIYLAILAVVLLVISVALISNTISLSIYSRRFNIHTMKLVGATNSFIRRPFVRAGMLTGVIAGVIATFVVCGLQAYLMVNDTFVGPWLDTESIAITACVLVVLGALLARAAAWRAATVYLNKNFDSLFKK